MKQQRAELSRREVYQRSAVIADQLLSIPEYFRADTVHIYVSSKNNEVDTHELIRIMLRQKKRVVVPIAEKGTAEMKHSEIHSLSELVGGAYGILVPRLYRPVSAKEIQGVVVPALAVDRAGNRIGFGVGFYDRFLATVQIPTFALVYSFQILSKIPAESTDIPVSFVVTEDEIVHCRNNSKDIS
jgi:5-formyltetrahydrofolate cyclo-ligase